MKWMLLVLMTATGQQVDLPVPSRAACEQMGHGITPINGTFFCVDMKTGEAYRYKSGNFDT